MAETDTLSPRQLWTIATAAWATSMIAAGFAFVGPVLILLLERMTGSGTFIGAFATVGAVTTVTLTPLAPRLMSRVRAPVIVSVGCLGAAMCFPLFHLVADPVWWFAIRFAQGLFLTVVFVVCETWINTIAPERLRGRILGAYGICLAGGLGLGAAAAALLIQTVGLEGWLPFAIGAAIVGAGVLPLLARRHLPMDAPSAHDSSLAVMASIMRGSPGLFAAVFAFGAIEYSLFHMVPVFGVRRGFAEGAAALLLLGMPLGNVLLNYPIGALADRLPRPRVLVGLFAACIATGLALAVLSHYWALMAALAVFVGVATGLYTVGLAMLSERHSGGRMAAANSSFILMYGVGSLVSPLVIGAGFDAVGPSALPLVLSALAGVGLVVFLATEGRGPRLPATASRG